MKLNSKRLWMKHNSWIYLPLDIYRVTYKDNKKMINTSIEKNHEEM